MSPSLWRQRRAAARAWARGCSVRRRRRQAPFGQGVAAPKSAKTVATWARRFAAANIGVACGPSGVVVVDVDEPELVEAMLERFGDTPLMTRTPSGGAHLWYRKVGEVKSSPLGPSLVVDIKADGGQVIVPPSFNRQSGVSYEFERGSWDDLTRLPPFRKEALDELGLRPSHRCPPRATRPRLASSARASVIGLCSATSCSRCHMPRASMTFSPRRDDLTSRIFRRCYPPPKSRRQRAKSGITKRQARI